MARPRKRPAPPPKAPRRRSWLRPLRPLLLASLPFVIAAGLAYLAYQDYSVRQQFEGKRWALPARVYASPVELFPGAPYDPGRLVAALDELKFRNDPSLSSRATYARRGSELIIKTRDFKFWDKLEPARDLRIRFGGQRIASVVDVEESRELSILRLEPVQIGSFYPTLKEDRILVRLADVPKLLSQGLFAIEDRHFYEHHGISIRGILRALWTNVLAGSIVQGGSTLTQQLVKNFFLTAERTWWRKINEAVMAMILEARYSKDQILEAYLNEIYLGQDGARAIHGFGLASQFYFSRSLDELAVHHIALLVGLVRGPSFYDPFQAPDKAQKRRNTVLDAMADEGYISAAEAEEAKRRPLDVVVNPHQAISRYPAFLDLVRRQLQDEYQQEDLTSEGLRIFSTLDVEAQQGLEAGVAETMKSLDRGTRSTALETAAILTRRANGEIVGLVGSRDPNGAGFNRALDAERQIGSLYKPVVYLTALQDPSHYTVVTPIADKAIRLRNPGGGAWSPKNYDGREHGVVALRTALAQSYNLATVRLGMNLGVKRTVETLHKLGVQREVAAFPALLLGAAAFTPIEVAQMYQTLASDGFATPLAAIQAVVAQDGRPLRRYGLSVKQTLDPSAVYLLNTVLQEAVAKGTGRPAYATLPRSLDIVGKTGTTNDLRDSWFAGYTGDYLGVVWIGRDDNQSAKLSGAQGALRVWTSVMKRISREPVQLSAPDNIRQVWIDRGSGLRTTEDCENAVLTPFIVGSIPASGSCGEVPQTEDSSATTVQ